ncbi:MAG: IPT/TIG domain-containing protein [Cytophagales bacterium]|nr:IPT/TIG domain-containing protein [Cytophagales bacterium]
MKRSIIKGHYFLLALCVFLIQCSDDDESNTFQITSITPAFGTCGDIISINGNAFGNSLTDLRVLLNEVELEIRHVSDDRINIILSEEEESGQIEVFKGELKATSEQTLEVSKPGPIVIESISTNEGFFGDEILIRGENFDPEPTKNIVRLGFTEFEVISATRSSLRVSVPFAIDRRGTFTIEIGCRVATDDQEFWINTSQGSWNSFWNDRWHDGRPVESKNFIVYSEKSSQAMRRQIASEAEISFDDLKSIIDYQEGEFRFREDYETDQIHILADYNQQPWVGLAYRDGFIIRARDSPRYNGDLERWKNVFQHEMAHVVEFLMIGEFQYRQANTVWMREGFGNYGARNHRVQTVAQLNTWRNQTRNLPGEGKPDRH